MLTYPLRTFFSVNLINCVNPPVQNHLQVMVKHNHYKYYIQIFEISNFFEDGTNLAFCDVVFKDHQPFIFPRILECSYIACCTRDMASYLEYHVWLQVVFNQENNQVATTFKNTTVATDIVY